MKGCLEQYQLSLFLHALLTSHKIISRVNRRPFESFYIRVENYLPDGPISNPHLSMSIYTNTGIESNGISNNGNLFCQLLDVTTVIIFLLL